MTAKEYLKQIRKLDVMIRQKEQELNTLRESAVSTGSFDYSTERVQTSPPGDAPYTCDVENVIDLDAQVKALVKKRKKIVNSIYTLKNSAECEVLFKRYVQGKHFESIAGEMGYSAQHVFRIHADGLKNLKFSKR